jgi:hypothetical protein
VLLAASNQAQTQIMDIWEPVGSEAGRSS